MKLLRAIGELAAVVAGSMAAGFAIGTAQHFLVFAVWDGGFGPEHLHSAVRVGGVVGAVFGIPTGLIIYYGILKREVTLRAALQIAAFGCIVGCTAGLAFYWMSCFFTPLVTAGFAHWRAYQQRKLQRPATAAI